MPQALSIVKQEPTTDTASSGLTIAKSEPDSPSWLDSVKDYASEAFSSLNPSKLVQGVNQAVLHPIDTASAMLQNQGAVEQKAEDAFKRGDYVQGVRHVINYLLPVIGPRLDQAGDYMQQGQYAKGLGATTDVALQTMGPEAAGKALSALPKVSMAPANAAVRDAVAFGQANKIPVDAATATDNAAVRMAQNVSDRSLGGAQVANKAQQAQATGLATVGQQLAAKGYSVPQTAEQAGQAVASGVTATRDAASTAADAAYGQLRAIEAQRPIPVNLAPVKSALEPIYATMAKGADIAPLQGSKATAVRAMARILNGPDVAGASEVDSALSDLKSMQRDAQNTPGAAAANAAVSQVHNAVMQAVTQAGPDAVKALTQGRQATVAKYAAQDVLDSLNAEPVRTTKALTAPGDSSIAQLRAVAQQAPGTLPLVGRSVLDGMLDRATEAGGFAHADKLYADWQKLGDQTKSLLFQDPAYIKDLDNFFLLAKKMGENPNPSGSAYGVGALAQASQLANPLHFAASVGGSAGLSALLHSDAGVRLLTAGTKLPPVGAVQAAWMARVKDAIRATQVTGMAGAAATGPGQ